MHGLAELGVAVVVAAGLGSLTRARVGVTIVASSVDQELSAKTRLDCGSELSRGAGSGGGGVMVISSAARQLVLHVSVFEEEIAGRFLGQDRDRERERWGGRGSAIHSISGKGHPDRGVLPQKYAPLCEGLGWTEKRGQSVQPSVVRGRPWYLECTTNKQPGLDERRMNWTLDLETGTPHDPAASREQTAMRVHERGRQMCIGNGIACRSQLLMSQASEIFDGLEFCCEEGKVHPENTRWTWTIHVGQVGVNNNAANPWGAWKLEP
ncbi:hypothetical protein AURDEDRAFT_127381 [Auricularia subglabra TFB-10046 SS5]|uniref:Uncharacterized protein n=1 Tax=Auricularia subglabra (strain TFB-10046 / SS5) TaxID=717982 RepID=J0DD58_AURST|nr:hypothetical protein AURDEDRAFT_127381 [Auricularia subglabra TFB-10046 SS5]